MSWIDISVAIRDGMVHWPDNPPVVVERTMDMERGAKANASKLSLGVHTATHMDAPSHFKSGAASIDQMPFDAGVGLVRVIEIRDPTHITVAELDPHAIAAGERILLKTANSPRAWGSTTFVQDAVHLSVEAAQCLAATRVRTIGIDYLSVGGMGGGLALQAREKGKRVVRPSVLADTPAPRSVRPRRHCDRDGDRADRAHLAPHRPALPAAGEPRSDAGPGFLAPNATAAHSQRRRLRRDAPAVRQRCRSRRPGRVARTPRSRAT